MISHQLTERHERWLFWLICASLVLNLLDAVLTVMWLAQGAAVEANPLMDQLMRFGPVFFVIVKCCLVSLGSYLLWLLRHRGLAVIGIFLMFLAYYWLLLYHLKAMNLSILKHLLD